MPENTSFEDRQPIIPLSYEEVEKARPKEFVFDYTNNIAYVKLANGTLFNITESEASLQFVKQYLEDNPDLILGVTVKPEDGSDERTIQESVDHIYVLIQEFNKKEFKYAGSPADGGPANRANKVKNSISFVESSSSTTSFNGEESKKVNISTLGLLKKTGGYVNGPMIPKKKFLLTENATYGLTLPKTGVEGQIFILLKEDV